MTRSKLLPPVWGVESSSATRLVAVRLRRSSAGSTPTFVAAFFGGRFVFAAGVSLFAGFFRGVGKRVNSW